jgi:hypothetical protein
MANAIRPMPWPASAIENSGSSSQRFGWLSIGKNRAQKKGVAMNAFLNEVARSQM